MAVPVDHDSLALEHGSGGRLFPELPTAEFLLDPLNQYLRAVRLGDVVIGSSREANQLIRLFGLCRHHDDGDVARASTQSQLVTYLKAGLSRKHQVKHDHIGQLELSLAQTVEAVLRRQDLEPFTLEIARQYLDEAMLVLDQ